MQWLAQETAQFLEIICVESISSKKLNLLKISEWEDVTIDCDIYSKNSRYDKLIHTYL